MITCKIANTTLQLETDARLFSPKGLDAGTSAMLSCLTLSPDDKVLDLGCGYGPVGIYVATQIGPEHVTMSDIDPAAVQLSSQNAARNGVAGVRVLQSDGFRGIDDAHYTLILSNPPYHADFSIPKAFIEKGFNRLALGGRMLMVTKRRDWYKNKFIAVFGGVDIHEIDGYFVFIAEKRKTTYAVK